MAPVASWSQSSESVLHVPDPPAAAMLLTWGCRRRCGWPLWILWHLEQELHAHISQPPAVNCFRTLVMSSLFKDVGIKRHLKLVYFIIGIQLPLLPTKNRDINFSLKRWWEWRYTDILHVLSLPLLPCMKVQPCTVLCTGTIPLRSDLQRGITCWSSSAEHSTPQPHVPE